MTAVHFRINLIHLFVSIKAVLEPMQLLVGVSPSRENAVLQAGGLTAQPSALVAGGAAAGQRGAGGREGSDQQAAERRCGDTRRDGKRKRR